jgi:hypothetical protein
MKMTPLSVALLGALRKMSSLLLLSLMIENDDGIRSV